MEFERRIAGTELRAEGRKLSGTVMKYGDVSPSVNGGVKMYRRGGAKVSHGLGGSLSR